MCLRLLFLIAAPCVAIAEVCRVQATSRVVHDAALGLSSVLEWECAVMVDWDESEEEVYSLDISNIVEKQNILDSQLIEFNQEWLNEEQTIVFPPRVAVKTIDPVHTIHSHVRKRKLESEGKVIVIRVSTADAEPISSAEEIADYIFGEEGTLASQTLDCSGGAAMIRPLDSNAPVLEVRVDGRTSDYTFNQLFLAANPVVKRLLGIQGRLDLIAQFAMFIAPHGLKETLDSAAQGQLTVAFAGFRHFKSVYSDLFSSSAVVTMHTTGHNRGLGNSFQLGSNPSLADDTSSAMGNVVSGATYQCYNGADYATLGWQNDRILRLENPLLPGKFALTFFGNYSSSTTSTTPTVIEYGGFFLQLNLKEGINRDTRSHGNKVVVHRNAAGSLMSGTSLHAALDETSPTFRDESHDVSIEVCSQNVDGTGSAMVAIGLYDSSDLCGIESASPSHSPQFTDSPINTASGSPSVAPSRTLSSFPSDTPSDVPSDTPSDVPSSIPNDVPSSSPGLADPYGK